MLDQPIHLYLGLLEAVDTPQVRAACLATLSPAETQRAERFFFERHRRQYVLAHGLLRIALSNVASGIDPRDWSFVTNSYGRPFVAGPMAPWPLFFNLSHTDGCIACVVSSCEFVGIDVENTRQRGSTLAIAECYFSREEVETLRVLRPAERADHFFDYWTLKEAYLKARGVGLRLPLDQFSMSISSEQGIGIIFAPGFGDDPKRWRFKKCSPSIKHRLAIADGSGLAGGLPIVSRPWPMC